MKHLTHPKRGPGDIAPAELQSQQSTWPQALLKRKQLAVALAMSERTIDNLQRQKKIPVVKISPRCCRYDLAAVLRSLGRFTINEAR